MAGDHCTRTLGTLQETLETSMERLNCVRGTRYASGWTNFDFHGDGTHVERVNLLAGFPFLDNSCEATKLKMPKCSIPEAPLNRAANTAR